MSTFTSKSLIYFFGSLFLFVALYTVCFRAHNWSINKGQSDAYYIWGDSVTFYDLDWPRMEQELGKPVFMHAIIGGSILDFLVFAESVPKNSTVIINLNEDIFLRKPEEEYHRSGLSFYGMFELLKENYTIKDLLKIFINNHNPFVSAARDKNDALPDSSLLRNIIDFELGRLKDDSLQEQFAAKRNLFSKNLPRLQSKVKKMFLINFKFSEHAEAARANSRYTKDFNEWLKPYVTGNTVMLEMPQLDAKTEMHDHAHANVRGRTRMTAELVSALKNSN